MNKFPPISRWCPHGDRQKEFAIFHPLSPSGIRWTTERRQETFRIARERFDWSHPFRRRPHFEFFFSYSDASSHQWQTGEGDLMTPIYNVERLINFNWWNYSEINLALLTKGKNNRKWRVRGSSAVFWDRTMTAQKKTGLMIYRPVDRSYERRTGSCVCAIYALQDVIVI